MSAIRTSENRPRARDLGIDFDGEPGPWNAITDVPGIEVGVSTLVKGHGRLVVGHGPVRTGVTAILPRGRSQIGTPCAAGWYSLNGNGEMTGTTCIDEVGYLDLPVLLSNTHSIGVCHAGVIKWANNSFPHLSDRWLLPVCAETYDGYLNDINGGHVTEEHVYAALDSATGGAVPEGSVGGGTGMSCYDYSGGNGTSSRIVAVGSHSFTVGAFVQTNFGTRSELTVAGRRVGASLLDDNPIAGPWHGASGGGQLPPGAGSVIVVVATDAPLLPGQCKALARRVPIGLGRTGTTGSHFSGDLFLAFSTADAPGLASAYPDAHPKLSTITFVPWGHMDQFYESVVQSVEEAVINSIVVNAEMTGRDGHRLPALPLDKVADLLDLPRPGTVPPGAARQAEDHGQG